MDLTTAQRRYRVKEIWRTLQGEGAFAGRPAVFVRLAGCNLWSGYEADRVRDAARSGAYCPLWCDTDFTKENSYRYSAQEIAQRVLEMAGDVRFCVVTGGEPLLQIDPAFVSALQHAGLFVAIETNGTVSLASRFGTGAAPDWIVCSPKHPESRLVLETFDELKIVVPDYHPQHYTGFVKRQRVHTLAGAPAPLLWLQPEDGPRQAEAMQNAIEWSLQWPQWRVSVQTHKVLNVA